MDLSHPFACISTGGEWEGGEGGEGGDGCPQNRSTNSNSNSNINRRDGIGAEAIDVRETVQHHDVPAQRKQEKVSWWRRRVMVEEEEEEEEGGGGGEVGRGEDGAFLVARWMTHIGVGLLLGPLHLINCLPARHVIPTLVMIGFQCSGAVSSVFGRSPLPLPFGASSSLSSPLPLSAINGTNGSSIHGVSGGITSSVPLPPNLLDYYPKLNNDGICINWAHAVNSRSGLTAALTGDDLMIEADVTLAETTRYPIPIMAHPPMNMSDITLDDWLVEVIRSETEKGIKLDFKSTRVVEPAFRVLARHAHFLKGPLILNADVLPGPNKPSVTPVDAWTFLMLCRTRFPKAIISIGWTTKLDEVALRVGYTRDMVDQMASLVKEYSLLQPVTFPVNGALMKTSVPEMQRLLFQVPNSTLTIWSHVHDPLTSDDLMMFRNSFSTSQIVYDVPRSILDPFREDVLCS